jgi:dimethylglycine dehydrogenase
MRQERDGLLWGPYESETKMKLCDDWYHNGVPAGFGMELFESDLDRLQEHIDKAMDMVPVLRDAEIQRVVCGPITYSPDILPMIGPVRGLHNYWCAVGFGYGIVHAGGAGRYLAEWILKGEPPYDLIELDPNRYSHWTDASYVMSKARESYGLNNLIGYPREERPAGRPTCRSSPIYDHLKSRGAQFGFHAGWEQPNWFALAGDEAGYHPSYRRTNWFEPVKREREMVTTTAGVIDLSPFGKIDVCGPDACRLLDHLTANELPSVGRTVITHMLTPRGRVYAELTVTRLSEDHFFCVTGSGSELHDLRWMEEVAWKGNYQVSISNVTDDWACLGLAGPHSRDALSRLVPPGTDLSDDTFPFLSARMLTVAGRLTRAVRISYTGELGWELYSEPPHLPTVYDALTSQTTTTATGGTSPTVGDFGTYALNMLRLEKGFRAWGSEMNIDTDPYEAGLGSFIKLNKSAEFIGKKALIRLKADGYKRRLVLLSVDTSDGVDPNGNESIWFGDRVVGNTTSGAYSVALGQGLAFGYLPTELVDPGTEVKVELLGQHRSATVLKGPPVKVESVRRRQMEMSQRTKTK